MKHLLNSLAVFVLVAGIAACAPKGEAEVENKTTYQVDHRDPSAVLQAVFDVAGGADPAVLGTLCDPLGKNDTDTRRICDLAGGFAPNDEFVQYFGHAKLNGDPIIDGTLARIPFLFGPNGDREETMEMVERDGKWYLKAF
ncbi:MAG: hypothetical protein AAGN35_20145 [Bacteroidota bacterium]